MKRIKRGRKVGAELGCGTVGHVADGTGKTHGQERKEGKEEARDRRKKTEGKRYGNAQGDMGACGVDVRGVEIKGEKEKDKTRKGERGSEKRAKDQ